MYRVTGGALDKRGTPGIETQDKMSNSEFSKQ